MTEFVREEITQHDIISDIANEKKDVFNRRQVAEIYAAILDKVEAALADGKNVVFTRFAKFELVDRQATTARNPQTGDTVAVPAKTVIKVRNRKRLHELTQEI